MLDLFQRGGRGAGGGGMAVFMSFIKNYPEEAGGRGSGRGIMREENHRQQRELEGEL